ncbi:CrcB family protein [Isoptericola sp. 4D.3]|uniref:Fluoride-specific ion channel FluC n=1 Tax=Isoptericola peretonis TaxID=2918523 RepID=A0ABT0J336_9MICO|nr:CrcB family protein [Isoptericola sp. 4D.3]
MTPDRRAARPPVRPRPAHRRLSLVALVAAGGAVGTASRYGLAQEWPAVDGWPVATFTANVLGAFVLGWLLEALAARGPETPAAHRVRLAVGTGVLGGFTTFSSLALETERLFAAGAAGQALAYAGVSLLLGWLACLGGVLLGSRRRTR